MPTTVIEHDYGWWSVPWSFIAYRLSWNPADGYLRLYEGGDTQFVLRLGKFLTKDTVDGLLDGWWEADSVEGRVGRDATWLMHRFPALASYALGRGAR